jgi:hypothetical protein
MLDVARRISEILVAFRQNASAFLQDGVKNVRDLHNP